MGDRAIIPRLAPATLVVSLLAVMLLKVWLMQPAALGPLWQPLLHHDAAIFGLVLAALAIVAALRQRTGMLAAVARRVAAAAMALLIVLYCVDAFVYWFFASRLYVSDVITFSSELSAAWSLLKSAYWIALNAPWVTLGCLVVGAVVTWSFLATVSARDGQQLPPRWLASASAIGLLIYGLELHAETKFYGDKPLYENFVERNWAFFRDGSFSAAHRAQLKSLVEATDCRPGHGKQLSIVLLIVESLSAYHSKYFSGVQDWTPHLDRIASLETALTNFHANGWTTIGGLISTLSGQFPMVPERGHFNEWGSPRLADFPVARRPIAKRLREAGYNTSFVAAGDVNFLDQRPWLRDIGFESVIGHTDPRMAYDGVRGPFSCMRPANPS